MQRDSNLRFKYSATPDPQVFAGLDLTAIDTGCFVCGNSGFLLDQRSLASAVSALRPSRAFHWKRPGWNVFAQQCSSHGTKCAQSSAPWTGRLALLTRSTSTLTELLKREEEWTHPERFRRLAVQRQELERRLTAERKRSHVQLANRILIRVPPRLV